MLPGCEKDKECASFDVLLKKFDQEAVKHFEENQETYDLSPMTLQEQCVLREGISKYLERYRSWKLTVVDSFYFKSYFIDDITRDFLFVSTKRGRFYFIMLPELDEFMFGEKYYTYEDGNLRRLRDSAQFAVVKLQNDMLDRFLIKEVTHTHSIEAQLQQTQRLIGELFFLKTRKADSYEFRESLLADSSSNIDYINNFFDPIIQRSLAVANDANDYEIYEIEGMAHIFIEYTAESDDQLLVNMYVVPKKITWNLSYEIERQLFKHCFDEE
jgi:hypothetical protein